jgi:hypothetical protein
VPILLYHDLITSSEEIFLEQILVSDSGGVCGDIRAHALELAAWMKSMTTSVVADLLKLEITQPSNKVRELEDSSHVDNVERGSFIPPEVFVGLGSGSQSDVLLHDYRVSARKDPPLPHDLCCLKILPSLQTARMLCHVCGPDQGIFRFQIILECVYDQTPHG